MLPKIRFACDGAEQTRINQPQLTEDIWHNISNYLSTEEWAKAAGACKMTYRMPLKWVGLGCPTPPEGLRIHLV